MIVLIRIPVLPVLNCWEFAPECNSLCAVIVQQEQSTARNKGSTYSYSSRFPSDRPFQLPFTFPFSFYSSAAIVPAPHSLPHPSSTDSAASEMPPTATVKVNGTVLAVSDCYETVEDNIYVSSDPYLLREVVLDYCMLSRRD